MQLANLDDCVQDALKVRGELEDQINALLMKDTVKRTDQEVSESKRQAMSSTPSAATTLRRQLSNLRKRNLNVSEGLQRRNKATGTSNNDSKALLQQQQTCRQQIPELREDLYRTSEVAHAQNAAHRRDIASDLSDRVCAKQTTTLHAPRDSSAEFDFR